MKFHGDAIEEGEMNKPPKPVTLSEMAELICASINELSETEKAKIRAELDAAFPRRKHGQHQQIPN
jgi:hypothetical protein